MVKLGRTCLQDALPVTFGQQFSGYSAAFERQMAGMSGLEDVCLRLPLGATAVGTAFGASQAYRRFVFEELQALTGKSYQPEENF